MREEFDDFDFKNELREIKYLALENSQKIQLIQKTQDIIVKEISIIRKKIDYDDEEINKISTVG